MDQDVNHEPVAANGRELYGQTLRVLPVLPDRISSDVEEWRCEAWMRLDSRVTLDDITMRMHPSFRIAKNTLQQRNGRFRARFHLIAWHSTNRKSEQLDADLASKLIKAGIDPALNTTRGLTPGLINPALGEAGGRIPIPHTAPAGRPKISRNAALEEHLQGQGISESASQEQATAPAGEVPTPVQSQTDSPVDAGSRSQATTPPAAVEGNIQMPTPSQSQTSSRSEAASLDVEVDVATLHQRDTGSPGSDSPFEGASAQMPAVSAELHGRVPIYDWTAVGEGASRQVAWFDPQTNTYQFCFDTYC